MFDSMEHRRLLCQPSQNRCHRGCLRLVDIEDEWRSGPRTGTLFLWKNSLFTSIIKVFWL